MLQELKDSIQYLPFKELLMLQAHINDLVAKKREIARLQARLQGAK